MSTKIRLKKLKITICSKMKILHRTFNLIKKSRRGKFKIYIGMSAGVGKTYRMLQEAHSL
jgi:two-component system sensor histidine kinase KdpD